MDDLVTFLYLVFDANFFPVYSYLAIRNSFRIVSWTKSLELDFENVKQFFVDPSALSKRFKFILVRFNESEAISNLIWTLSLLSSTIVL